MDNIGQQEVNHSTPFGPNYSQPPSYIDYAAHMSDNQSGDKSAQPPPYMEKEANPPYPVSPEAPPYPTGPTSANYPPGTYYPSTAHQQYPTTPQQQQYNYNQYGQGALAPPNVLYIQPGPLANPPDDHMGYSLFVTICCCWLVGIFALMKSSECRSAISAGNRQLAEEKSQQAKKLGNIGVGLGILTFVVVGVIMGVYYGIVASNIASSSYN